MNPLLIEPTDVLFFRDAVPMSAGQGKGAGCRMPFPSTLHEAFRASLLRLNGEAANGKSVEGRPRNAARSGDWHAEGHDGKTFIATRAYRSLRTIGPLPWQQEKGLLLPIPSDVARNPGGNLARLQLWRDPATPLAQASPTPADYKPLCLPLAVTPPDKHGQLHGWWTAPQMRHYLEGKEHRSQGDFEAVPTDKLWSAEHRVGVQIDPGSFAASQGQLYAGSYLRAAPNTRFVAWAEIADPAKARNGEAAARQQERDQLAKLDWLLVGGEFRLARLWHNQSGGQQLPDPLADLRTPPAPPTGDGPCLLKWVLVTPAIFAHGSLPGWCAHPPDKPDGIRVGQVRLGASQRKTDRTALPGRAQLVSWCLARPRTVSGFDVVEGRAKPTMLAVPEGGVYYFLCENRETAVALAQKLHWQPRSDFYGEKGCGYGLVSFDVQIHPSSVDVRTLANELFNP
jgi:CRISPR type III-B/RAMP module-associated protein Cmr3